MGLLGPGLKRPGVSNEVGELVATLAQFDRLVEVGIGNRTAIAIALAEHGLEVTATDIHDRQVPAGVTFVRDDITDPDHSVYTDADLIYSLRTPPELHRSLRSCSRAVGVPVCFTTCGGDPPAVSVTPKTVGDETLYLPDDGPQSLRSVGTSPDP